MEVIICDKCGQSNSDTSVKCSNCGYQFFKNIKNTVGRYIDQTGLNESLGEPALAETGADSTPENIGSSESPVVPPAPQNLKKKTKSPVMPKDITNKAKTNKKANPAISDQIAVTAEKSCPRCSYILSDASDECPNCSFTLNKNKSSSMGPHESENWDPGQTSREKYNETSRMELNNPPDLNKTIVERHDTGRDFSPEDNKDSKFENIRQFNKTIRDEDLSRHQFNTGDFRYQTEIKAPQRLEAIFLDQDSNQVKIINLKKGSVKNIITRDIVDKDDNTISSAEHALIYKEKGKWKIDNKASNKAVFVQVNKSTEINNGDIILFGGDKFYVFINDADSE